MHFGILDVNVVVVDCVIVDCVDVDVCVDIGPGVTHYMRVIDRAVTFW